MAKKHAQTKPQPATQATAPVENGREKSVQKPSEAERQGFERLITFSDGVFAIAITLLVLDIRLPDSVQSMDNSQLLSALLALGPHYLAYVISFLVIGSLWMNHHRKFRLIQRYDRRLILLNIILLMTVAFIPFPTSVLSVVGNRTATIFYALTIALNGLIALSISIYVAVHRNLLSPEIGPNVMRGEIVRGLFAPVIFLGSISLAFINEDLARYSWILLVPTTLLFHRPE
jgi:uncharacterized membrane protein